MIEKPTVEELLVELEEARVSALEADQPGAAVNATIGKARLLGLLIDRKEVDMVMHRPAPLPTKAIELDEAEWIRQFDPDAGGKLVGNAGPGKPKPLITNDN